MSQTIVYTSAPTPAIKFASPIGLWMNLWQRRDLIWQFTVREVAGRYKGLNFGILWSFINPLLMLGIYTFVFGCIMHVTWNRSINGDPKPPFSEFALTLFCGLTVFNVFAECLGRAPTLIVSNPNYVKKVVFPLEILPVTVFGGAIIHGLISFIILMLFMFLIAGKLQLTALLFPIVLLPLVFLCLGVGWMLAALGVFFRDISYAMTILTQALVYITPVFFPMAALDDRFKIFMYLNPLSAVVENGRSVLLWGDMPDWSWLAKTTVVSLVFMQVGYIFFMKSKKAFADVI